MIRKLFIVISLPVLSIIVIFLSSYFYKSLENPIIAAGTVGAAISATWAVIYLEIIKPYFDRPVLEIREPGFKPHFYRKAPEINTLTKQQVGIGYYINILLLNSGNRTTKNCQPILTGMWEYKQKNWLKRENWIAIPLRWAAGEDYEYIESIQGWGSFGKHREERNLVPQRPYFFNLGKISTEHPQKFKILDIPGLTAQPSELAPGEYCFEVTVTGEEIKHCVKYFRVRWDGGCTGNLEEVEKRFTVNMQDFPP